MYKYIFSFLLAKMDAIAAEYQTLWSCYNALSNYKLNKPLEE